MIKAVIFDIWGTLVENGTYSPLKQSYSILRPHMAFSEFIPVFERAFMTKPFKDQAEGFTEVCTALGVPPKKMMIEKLIGLWNKNRMFAKLFPETIDVLTELKKKYKLALVSNTDSFITPLIERYEFKKYVDVTVFSYELNALKTDPEFFQEVLKKLGVKASEALVVGDSLETDIAGAQAAGIAAVLVDRRGSREFTPKILTLKDLSKYLETHS